MILEETINKLLRDIVNLILETPGFAIKTQQKDAPRPTGAYATVDFISDTPLGYQHLEYTDQQAGTLINVTARVMRDIMFSISFYRDGSVDKSRLVQQAFARESILELLCASNLSLIRRSEVRAISTALENTWESRSQFDIFLSAVGTDLDILESIGSVDMAGQFQARNLTYDFNIEV